MLDYDCIIYLMKSSWFPILLIIALLGLLVLLATLQFQWLGQISEAEQTRLEARLKDDTKRFGEDFDKEIANINLFFGPSNEDWNTFGDRYSAWLKKTDYPRLIETFYYLKFGEEAELTQFSKDSKTFESGVWGEPLRELGEKIEADKVSEQFVEKEFALLLPKLRPASKLENVKVDSPESVVIKRSSSKILTETIVGPTKEKPNVDEIVRTFQSPKKDGVLVVKLNEEVIRHELLTDLSKKYFSSSDAGEYKVSVMGKNSLPIFQTHEGEFTKPDANAELFKMAPTNFWIFREGSVRNIDKIGSGKKIVANNRVSTTASTAIVSTKSENKANRNPMRIELDTNFNSLGSEPRVKFLPDQLEGIWSVNVQHIDGSLEQFVANTRWRNLTISFGILSLLAISIILIFLSSQRAKRIAERQMNFVSGVSHEFRTPLSVIYSAGENLSDGVVGDNERISDYGNLIKREGKKLSGMVEQILVFAGAKSGKLKYDFRETDISKVIADALEECLPVIEDKQFEVEAEVAANLPYVEGDERALTQAIQNLLSNSLKYSNGNRKIKISAENGDGNIKIAVEDEGFGIAEKDLKQIFEPFYRSKDVVDEQIGGNGLGLSLVEQIVDAHDGKIDVKSEIGKGSMFTVHLPVSK